MSNAFEEFQKLIGDHVPPESTPFNPDNETTLRQGARYRVRVRGTDAQHEVVARFTGFGVPDDDAGEVLILEFVPEHSYADPADNDEKGPDVSD